MGLLPAALVLRASCQARHSGVTWANVERLGGNLGGCQELGQAELQGCLGRGHLRSYSKCQPTAALQHSLRFRERLGLCGEPGLCLHR